MGIGGGSLRAIGALGVAGLTVSALLVAAPAARAGQGGAPAPGSAKFTVRDMGGSADVGAIEGAVFDSDGDGLAEARVAVVNEASGVQWLPDCDTSGRFKVDGLAPGVYTLRVAASGLHTFVRTGIALGAHQSVHFDLALRDGEIGPDDVRPLDPGEKRLDDDDDSDRPSKKSKHKGNPLLRPFKSIKKIIPGVD